MRSQSGFTYLTALFFVALLATGLALAGEAWETSARREKEAELLFVGNQYRNAIRRYYESTPGGVKRYPRALEDLLSDPRSPALRRHIRRLYPDPLGGKEWGLVKAPDGGISGVFSPSRATPMKRGNFRLRDAGFESAKTYSDWQFVYSPAAAIRRAP
jgi:type II secretory pathway pseudopilin PulG